MKDFERQAAHRQELEKTVVHAQIDRAKRGQHYALVVAIAGLVCACILGCVGQTVAASIITSVDLVGLVVAFLYGRRNGQGKAKPTEEETEGPEE